MQLNFISYCNIMIYFLLDLFACLSNIHIITNYFNN